MIKAGSAKNRGRARRSSTASFPAPVAGWISNRNLSQPSGDGGAPPGAEVLDNFFPTATGCKLRRGSIRYATLTGGGDVKSLFTYTLGGAERLFAANDSYIFDITSISSPYTWNLGEDGMYVLGEQGEYIVGVPSTFGLERYPSEGNGNWVTVQFGTTGGTYLIGVNGSSAGFVYDSIEFYPSLPGGSFTLGYDAGVSLFAEGEVVTGAVSGASAKIVRVVPSAVPGAGRLVITDLSGVFLVEEIITGDQAGEAEVQSFSDFPTVPGLTFDGRSDLSSDDMSFVWAHKNRLWYIEDGTLNAWYGGIDSFQGEFTWFPLNGVLTLGGSLVFGASWSLNTSDAGGMSAQCVFVSSEGEVAVFQGTSPDDATTWRLVGVYRIGRPLGKHAFVRAGGDLVIATTIGMVPLSRAVQVDSAALAPASVSYAIETAWSEAVERRGTNDWRALLWPDAYMMLVSPPRASLDPVVMAANAQTGAWGRFTGWDIRSMAVFQGRLYFGGSDGRVILGNVSGRDEGTPYTGVFIPLFRDMGDASARKVAKVVRTDTRSSAEINERVSALFDWHLAIPPPPGSQAVLTGNEWDNAIWDTSVWSAPAASVTTQRRHSVGGYGYRMSASYQVTSDSIPALDLEIVAMDVSYEVAESFT